MRIHLLVAAAALAVAAGCERGNDTAKPSASGSVSTPAGSASGSASAGGTAAPTTPANVGQPSSAEKKDGANPTQGQVDPKEGEQRRDFQQPGDGAGPKSPDTKPKNGG